MAKRRKRRSKRAVFYVVPAYDGWAVKRGKRRVGGADLKREAVELGRDLAHEVYDRGGLSQLRVHRADGTIEYEHTYGADPRRHRG